MRSLRLLLRHSLSAPSVRRLLRPALELAAWTLAVLGLEVLGRASALGDVYDLGVLLVVVAPLALLAAVASSRGYLPLTRALAQGLERLGRRALKALERRHRYHVALRLPADARPQPDRPLLATLALLAALLVLTVVAGPRVLGALDALRCAAAYTPYLLCLALLWALMLGVVTLALVLESPRWKPRAAVGLWLAGLVASALLPAAALVGALLLLGLVQALHLRRRDLAVYLFCRRDGRQRLRAVPAQVLFRSVHAVVLVALALVAALGNSERLYDAAVGGGRFAFTGGLGVMTAVAALLLATRANLEFGRLLAGRTPAPETPLVPTLWWQGPLPVPADVSEAGDQGWIVGTGPQPAADDVDLVAGPEAVGPRALRRHPELPRAERAFRRLRRFHIVHRREFFRRLRSLLKRARGAGPATGSGYLFCPHVWLIQSLLRDGPRGAVQVGPPFAHIFSPRLRRYLGGFLREAGVDVLYWEDAVSWADLRRVLGVAFECWDQARTPLLERHFVGIPRVRVVRHDEDAVDPPEPVRGRRRAPEAVATGARVLMVLRDRGGDVVRDLTAAPSDRQPAPLVC